MTRSISPALSVDDRVPSRSPPNPQHSAADSEGETKIEDESNRVFADAVGARAFEMDEVMLQVMLDARSHNQGGDNGNFASPVCSRIEHAIRTKTTVRNVQRHTLINRWSHLKAKYWSFGDLLKSLSGWFWNGVIKTFENDEDVIDDFFMSHEQWRCFRKRVLYFHDELHQLLKGQIAMGDHGMSLERAIEIDANPPTSTPGALSSAAPTYSRSKRNADDAFGVQSLERNNRLRSVADISQFGNVEVIEQPLIKRALKLYFAKRGEIFPEGGTAYMSYICLHNQDMASTFLAMNEGGIPVEE